jgi:hypothetical protein
MSSGEIEVQVRRAFFHWGVLDSRALASGGIVIVSLEGGGPATEGLDRISSMSGLARFFDSGAAPVIAYAVVDGGVAATAP